LEPEEFEKGLASFGFFLKKIDLQTLIKYYDKDGDGSLNFEEFIGGIREPLNERRTKLVLKLYNAIDT